MKYRAKPTIKEAIKYLGPFSLDEMINEWGALFRDQCFLIGNQFHIKTLEGVMFPSIGDYIVKGIAGEFYSVKPDIFEKSYEPIGEL